MLPPMAGPAIKLSVKKASSDPRFKRVMDRLQRSAARTKQHPPAGQKAAEAQAAALPPANEKLAGAKAAQVGTMNNAGTVLLTVADMSAIQAEIERSSTARLFGWKIAATSEAGQKHINVTGPMAGRILSETIIPDGGTASMAGNEMPRRRA